MLRGVATDEVGPGGLIYQVQYVGPSERVYVCPGCRNDVGPGIEHVVAWPTDDVPFGTDAGVRARRHWHSECWRRGLSPHR